MKLYSVLAALATAVTAIHADQIKIIESNGTLSATMNGNPFAISVTGTLDNWTVEFPAGYTINLAQGTTTFVGEPGSEANLMNTVYVSQPGNGSSQDAFLLWTSDITSTQGQGLGNSINLNDAVTLPTGAKVDLLLQDLPGGDSPNSSVPDGGTTVVLLGMALAGMGLFPRLHKKA